ncbi:MAG: hypothetical protein OEW58_12010 [Gammaproteobacteria bacterium]|nr:hypothetical protein [Gammaproteobacteria bacterium]
MDVAMVYHGVNRYRLHAVLVLLLLTSLSGCAGQEKKHSVEEMKPKNPDPLIESLFDQKSKEDPKSLPAVANDIRMPLVAMRNVVPDRLSQQKYSLKVKALSVRETLSLLAATYNMNIYAEPDVVGNVDVSFNDVPLDEAMDLILGSLGYYWEWSDNLIQVKKFKTVTFDLDYLRLTRNGQGSSSSSISSTGGSGGGTTATQLTQQNNVAFWDELDTQLRSMLSANGRVAINRLSGTIQITDEYARTRNIESYIKHIKNGLHKQVEIETRIIEVSLRDDQSMGIDWTELSAKKITGALTNIVTQANGGMNLRSATAGLTYTDPNFKAIISALSEQGEIKVVSQPRIRTMNNQTALIKVGTDRTFFSQEVTRQQGAAGNIEIIITEIPTTVTEGVVLSLTPQISNDNWVLMDVSPVITRVTDTVVSSQGSIAPVLDIKQSSTLVRAKHNEMIILGGLIQDENVTTERSVPFLGRIPLLGYFFRGTYHTKVRKELVIFLMPRIVG